MENLMEKIVSLSKRRGFVFPSSEIYGGFSSSYDFGPLGVELKRNIKDAWWQEMTQFHKNIVGLDAAILMAPKVWEVSGHLSAGFADELVECIKCHKRFRLEEIKENKCPECEGEVTKPKKFNLLVKTSLGAVEEAKSIAYLRPETCQGIYVNFKNVLDSLRLKLPFGIAQIGKAFRNEITTKNFIFRTREFEQMEMQWFCRPSASKTMLINADKDADKRRWGPDEWFSYWKKERLNWYLKLGLKKDNLRFREIPQEKRAHYAKRQIDLEYRFPFASPRCSSGEAGWQEIEGIHNRGDWDLSRHSKASNQNLKYLDPDSKEEFIPHIIETSVGVERSLLAFLIDAYQEIKGGRSTTTEAIKETEVVLKLHPKLAPIQVAILPLAKKPELVKVAKDIFNELRQIYRCEYDETQSIGKRYRRQDEIGTPLCVTIDFDSVKDKAATIRERDSMKQERIKIVNLKNRLKEKLDEI